MYVIASVANFKPPATARHEREPTVVSLPFRGVSGGFPSYQQTVVQYVFGTCMSECAYVHTGASPTDAQVRLTISCLTCLLSLRVIEHLMMADKICAIDVVSDLPESS